jgi:hypothetical protein
VLTVRALVTGRVETLPGLNAFCNAEPYHRSTIEHEQKLVRTYHPFRVVPYLWTRSGTWRHQHGVTRRERSTGHSAVHCAGLSDRQWYLQCIIRGHDTLGEEEL